MFKRWLYMMLILLLLTGGGAAMAAQIADVPAPLLTTASGEKGDPLALFERYADGLFTGRRARKATGLRLSGPSRNVYTRLKSAIGQVAAGTDENEGSTEFTFPVEEIYPKTVWTAEDLGVDQVVIDGAISDLATNSLFQITNVDLSVVMEALLSDCPYELYWYDKVAGMDMGGYRISTVWQEDKGAYALLMKGNVVFHMNVCEAFRLDTYQVDTSWAQTADSAAARARGIVDAHAAEDDRTKLTSYKDEICALVSYNRQAVEGDGLPYGNPWQLIWVFDDDEETNVVCEGYSKAFQYLCDESTFSSADCYTVSGKMATSGQPGNHMWNIVTMDDHRNYLVDITNSDAGAYGAGGGLFLNGYASGDVDAGYVYATSSGNVSYTYGDRTKSLYSAQELTLSDVDYAPELTPIEDLPTASGKCGDDAVWALRDGTLSVTGTGAVYEYTVLGGGTPAPWAAWYDEITAITIDEGITAIGARAFYGADAASVELPQSLERIDQMAFAYCTALEAVVIPDGVTTLGARVFMGDDALAEAVLPSALTAVPEGLFYNCTELGDIVIPEMVASIGANAFYGCRSMAQVTVPQQIERIEAAAFAECQSLRTVTLPQSLTWLGARAFIHDYALESVTLEGAIPSIGVSAFEGCARLAAVTLPEGLSSIGASAFFGCGALASIAFPGTLESIGLSAFEGCASLEGIALPEGLTSIGAWAFLGCPRIKSVDIPAGLSTIGNEALGFTEQSGDPEKITGFMLYGYLGTAAEDYAENNNLPFTAHDRSFEARLDRRLLSQGDTAVFTFSWSAGWPSLPSVDALTYETSDAGVATAGGGVVTPVGAGGARITVYADQDISASVFVAVRDVAPLCIPSGVQEIEEEAFMGLFVTEIVVPEGVRIIGARAFADCARLCVLELPDSLETIADDALDGAHDVVVVAAEGSAGQLWAARNGFMWEEG
ncbi:MAG: hypothetical protein E7317_06825 [Clostridiales bacterium]|nr:hypothetical protein [Clostridiales bacterium]